MDLYEEWCRRARPVFEKFPVLFSVAAVRRGDDVTVEFADVEDSVVHSAELLDVAEELLPLARELVGTFPYEHGEYAATRGGFGFRQQLYVDEPKPRATKKAKA